MPKISSLCVLILTVMSACTGNKFLKQKYTNFKIKGHPSETLVKNHQQQSDKKTAQVNIADIKVEKNNEDIFYASAETRQNEKQVIPGKADLAGFVADRAIAIPVKIVPLNAKLPVKKEQKKFILGFITSVLGMVLFILVIVLVCLLVLALIL